MRQLILATAAILALVTGTVTAAAQLKPGEWYVGATVAPEKGPVEYGYYPLFFSTKALCEKSMHDDTFLGHTAEFIEKETREHGHNTVFTFACRKAPGEPGQPINFPQMQVPNTSLPGDI